MRYMLINAENDICVLCKAYGLKIVRYKFLLYSLSELLHAKTRKNRKDISNISEKIYFRQIIIGVILKDNFLATPNFVSFSITNESNEFQFLFLNFSSSLQNIFIKNWKSMLWVSLIQ